MAKGASHKGEGHRKRLREKFLSAGLAGFHDYEVIELLLTLATPRRDCKDAAKAALKHFKTLQGVCDASPQDLTAIPGLGPNNILGIRLVKAVADRYLEKKVIHRDPIRNSKELFDFLHLTMRDLPKERFSAVFLDAKNRVIEMETLFEGTLTGSSVYPREVIVAALQHHAAAVIFAHNHPSGDPHPSEEDRAVTRKLIFACGSVGVTVHEHLIIGDQGYFSFADEGYIARLTAEFDRIHNNGL